LDFIIERCNYSLTAFRHPEKTTHVPMEDFAHNTKTNKEI